MTSKRRLFFILAVFLGLVLLSGIGAGAAATRAWRQFNQSTPLEQALAPAVRAWRFDLLRYEIGAVSGKVGDLFRRPGVRLNEDEQRRLVEQYQQRALTIRRLQDEVERRYADPAAVDPAAITADARARDQATWKTVGTMIFPNCFSRPTYAEEVDALRAWIADRITWLDGQLADPGTCP